MHKDLLAFLSYSLKQMRVYLKVLTTFSSCFMKHCPILGCQSAQFLLYQDIPRRVSDPLLTVLGIGRDNGHLPPANSQGYTFH
jgi:hypothetical protein